MLFRLAANSLGLVAEINLSLIHIYASYVSTQSILQREIAQNYTTAAQSYNAMASGFPANVIGTLWGCLLYTSRCV